MVASITASRDTINAERRIIETRCCRECALSMQFMPVPSQVVMDLCESKMIRWQGYLIRIRAGEWLAATAWISCRRCVVDGTPLKCTMEVGCKMCLVGLLDCRLQRSRYRDPSFIPRLRKSFHSKIARCLLFYSLSIDGNHLRLENEHAVCRNWSHSTLAIAVFWLDSQPSLVTGTHVQQALIPSFDHLTTADCEGKGCSTIVGGIEFRA